MSRISIFVGHFGSGKTEVAINYALKLKEQKKKTALIDLDIVNPYFCSRQLKSFLEDKGIRVICSPPDLLNGELMVVPPGVISAFNDKSSEIVFDIGGDGLGAIALGQYNKYFREEVYNMYFVVNNNRPLTAGVEDTKEYIQTIEQSSRLKVTDIISNTNLSYETTEEDILVGDREILKLSQILKIPYTYLTCRKDLISAIEGKVGAEVFPIDIYMKPPWIG
ncbi:hypothetical protein CPJCM30710_26230 [Clostridium polyendosporum]|uniref:CobQ/CobB/MinD/ParA nucleotide binding domain-containing protein n=1 Tax=Clostridium polyendosporum TaxID=69208 RepID=A0A919VH75_9CLOT|nr:ATP-binding protein [Clostridium polyendosporum]GIM29957.1 hypothetical protein CPJCM30710_26230 [Clostridium polyendosporum]